MTAHYMIGKVAHMNSKKPITVSLSQLALINQANPAGNIHGGEIMKMMDCAAGVAAQKYANTNVVTAQVDELTFKRPVYVGNLITCHAQIIYTGSSSIIVFVCVEVEDILHGKPSEIALTSFFTMVSLDEHGNPNPVPPLEIPTEDPFSFKLYLQAKNKYTQRKKRLKK